MDGIPIPQRAVDALATIDPGDIERIEVMRGGAEGWRYGIQGANGVVRITTRNALGGYGRRRLRRSARSGSRAEREGRVRYIHPFRLK